MKKWPDIWSADVIYYLLYTKACDMRDVKAYKSLESYNYLKSGWVGKVLIHEIDSDLVLLKGSVQGSQSSKKLNQVWVCAKREGQVVTAGCTCMAGKARVCSHVGAILWKVDAAASSGYTGHACTDEGSKWNQGTKKNIVPSALCNIDFQLERGTSTSSVTHARHAPQAKKFRAFRDDKELEEFLATAPFQGLFNIPGKYKLFLHGHGNVSAQCVINSSTIRF